MSSSRGSLASRINANEEEINELIVKLQALLPERNHGHLRRVCTTICAHFIYCFYMLCRFVLFYLIFGKTCGY